MSGQCGSSRRRRVSRKMRGGMGYGFGGTIGTAGPVWDSSWGGEVTKSGTPIYDTADRPPVTGGRRRKSRRGGVKEGEKEKEVPKCPGPKCSDRPAPRVLLMSAEEARKPPRLLLMSAAEAKEEAEEEARRSRKGGKRTKKSKKAGRRHRRRTMKGGMSVAHASAGFSGQGERGMANYTDVGSSQPFSNDVVPLS